MENLLETAMGENPLNLARALSQSIDYLLFNYKDMEERLAEYERRIQELEQENERLRNEQQKDVDWTSRVTYENVVEQIAACEDAKERDEARKLIEPLLKKSMVTRFRKDIKRRVKEQNDDGNAATFNNYGTYNEIQTGGTNITNHKEDNKDGDK